MARPTQNQKLRENSLRKIFDAAVRFFVSKGYFATSVEEIATAAGLTKGAVYFYFESKEELLLRLLDIVEENIVDRVIEHLAAHQSSPRDKLVAFFHFQSRHGIERPDELLVLILMGSEFSHRHDPISTRLNAIYARIYRTIEDIVEAGKAEGQFTGELPTREFASFLIAAHDGIMLEWHKRRDELDGAGLIRSARTVLLGGVGGGTRHR